MSTLSIAHAKTVFNAYFIFFQPKSAIYHLYRFNFVFLFFILFAFDFSVFIIRSFSRNTATVFAVRRKRCIHSIFCAVRRSQGLSVYLSHELCAWRFTPGCTAFIRHPTLFCVFSGAKSMVLCCFPEKQLCISLLAFCSAVKAFLPFTADLVSSCQFRTSQKRFLVILLGSFPAGLHGQFGAFNCHADSQGIPELERFQRN